jgi:hypothetical protein
LVAAATCYFLLIGLGFMFVEIGLIQRVSIFLGHPTYGLSIVLFSIILSTGLGSVVSERLSPFKNSSFLTWALAIGCYLFLLPSWLPGGTHAFQSSGLAARGALTVAAIFPAGVMMGRGFPTGMRLIAAAEAHQATPWLWGINGAAGVLAAGLAVACSIAFSIDATLRVGAVCYFLLIPCWLVLTEVTKTLARSDARRAGAAPLTR